MTRVILIYILLSFNINLLIGQEQLGLHIGNHTGINSISINPANAFLSPHTWDINIISGGFFFDNSYGFLRNINTIRLIKNRTSTEIVYDSKENTPTSYTAKTVLLDFYKYKKESYFALSGNITGPSISIKINDENLIGFVSAFRFLGNVHKIPRELEYYTYYDKKFFQPFPITSFNSGFMSWQEYGINYEYKIKGYSPIMLLGGTLKYLVGNEAIFFNNKSTFQFQQMPNDSIAALDKIHLQYGYSNTNFKSNNFQLTKNGAGASIDVGATFIFGENLKNYKLRVGVSILDLGFINYNKNSSRFEINTDTFTVIDLNTLKGIEELSQVDSVNQYISQQIFGDNQRTLVSNSFRMWLPLALSIQIDYSFSNLFFVNGVFIQRLTKVKNSATTRANLLAISPRIEHNWFSASAPLIIYDWKKIRLGLSLRLAYLTIGSDNIFSIFSIQSKYSGTDFYIGLKFFPFSNRKRNKHSKNLNKNIKCYKF